MAAVPVASGSCPVGDTGFRFSWPQCVVGRARTVFQRENEHRNTGFVPRFRCRSVSSGSSGFCLIHVGDAPRLKSRGFGCAWYGCARTTKYQGLRKCQLLQLMISDFYCEQIESELWLYDDLFLTLSCFRSPNFGRTVMYRR